LRRVLFVGTLFGFLPENPGLAVMIESQNENV
jgi:hypothetical protein